MKNHLKGCLCLCVLLSTSWLSAGSQKSLVDYFQPMEPVGELKSEGIWGNTNVLPRDIQNGLEDPDLDQWCYWDGRIVKGDDGRYHVFSSRWGQEFSHSDGWKQDSKGIHAVSDHVMGPYVDKGVIYPQWRKGMGSNVIGMRMHDGRWAVITSEITPGTVFVSDSPDGPFELLGEIEWDANGFSPGLAAYRGGEGNMSNVQVILRHDGRYMIVARSTAVMISDNGILGPYKIMTDRMYAPFPELPQSRNEDPTVWHSGGMYHIVYNHWPSKTAYHFSSEDGITDWKYRGIAYEKGKSKLFTYPNELENKWEFIERPTAYVEDGHVTHFIFSVLDVHKGRDGANDNHGSKIVVVPFDGEAFDRDMREIVEAEKRRSNDKPSTTPALKAFDLSEFSIGPDIPEGKTYYHGSELDVVEVGDSFTVSVDFTFEQTAETVKKDLFHIGATTGPGALFATFHRFGWGDNYAIGMMGNPEGCVFESRDIGLPANSKTGKSDPLRMILSLTRQEQDKWTMTVHIRNLKAGSVFERHWEKRDMDFPGRWVKSLNGVFQVGQTNADAGVKNRRILDFKVSNDPSPAVQF